jgi:hypothetical protein
MSAGIVLYGYPEDDDDALRDRIVIIDAASYTEMGEPGVISITIEPGDNLNG